MKVLSFFVLLIVGSGVSFATDVTFCGQKIVDGDTGVLQADLDCSAASGIYAAVLIGNRSTLSLNGHTIIGGPADGVAGDVSRRFAIVGPGAINGSLTGIAGGLKTRVSISDVDLSDNQVGIQVVRGTLDLTNVTIASLTTGMVSSRSIRAQTLTVTTNGHGDCILGDGIRGTDVTVTGCFTGIGVLGSVRIDGLTAVDNVTIGVSASRVRLMDSVVTGNTFIGQPLDILSSKRPVLLGTSCGVSRQKLPDGTIGATWGVCADD
jgi:hypothetical protein